MAATDPAGGPPLQLTGLPRRLTLRAAALAEGEQGELELPEQLAAFAGGRTLAVPLRRAPDGSASARVRLSRLVPPGRYAAALRVGDRQFPVEIEVAAAPRLRIFPPSADFVAPARGSAEVRLTLTNDGNVAVELPERVAIGLFDDDGLETAFADTYRQEGEDALKLLGHFFGKLREGYGGLLHLQVDAKDRSVSPGVTTTAVLKATLREGQRAGHSYHGAWSIGPVNYRVNVSVTK